MNEQVEMAARTRPVVGYRYNDVLGRSIHDGDCHFWSYSICTCGLLHQMASDVETNPPWYFEETSSQRLGFEWIAHLKRTME